MSQIVLQHYARPTHRRHLWIGLAMTLIAATFATGEIGRWFAQHPAAVEGLSASLFAGLATGLGALPILFLRRPGPALMAPMLGLAGGMMLAASLFSLLVPAIQHVAAGSQPGLDGLAVAVALLAGAAAMQYADRRLPHAHVDTVDSAPAALQPKALLVIAAIALHNLPEGLAVGVAATAGADHGLSIGIALQNIPEGWIVASALLALGARPLRAALMALATGLVEPLGGLFGVVAASVAGAALPLALAAAAGAMLWVVSHELIPASHPPGRAAAGTAGLIGGFAVMTVLASIF